MDEISNYDDITSLNAYLLAICQRQEQIKSDKVGNDQFNEGLWEVQMGKATRITTVE